MEIIFKKLMQGNYLHNVKVIMRNFQASEQAEKLQRKRYLSSDYFLGLLLRQYSTEAAPADMKKTAEMHKPYKPLLDRQIRAESSLLSSCSRCFLTRSGTKRCVCFPFCNTETQVLLTKQKKTVWFS